MMAMFLSQRGSMNEQELFAKLSHVLDTLLGPGGCSWDQKQTLDTLRQSVLEETCELIDTIEARDSTKMNEELGDLLFNVIFLAKVAAKEGHFTLGDTLQVLIDKLIYRHPHVFGGGEKMENVEEIVEQWEALKKKEREKTNTKSMLDGIPKTLPSLARAQKIIGKMKRAKIHDAIGEPCDLTNEEELGKVLYEIVRKAEENGLDAELALRKQCNIKEAKVRAWEAPSSEGA